jgi:short-subunit dehydrogenase
LITGASGGLGEAIALECARRGARLALASRNLKDLKKVAAKAAALGSPKAQAYSFDVTGMHGRSLIKKVEKEFGGVDALVNNAGVHFLSPVEAIPETDLKRVMETNFFGPLRLVQAVLPGMKRAGRGLVVNIGSTLGLRALPGTGGYAASKAALARLSESLRIEVASSGVKVLQVSPGVVTTRLREHALYVGEKPAPSSSLPFHRTPEKTAFEIVNAMEAGKRDLVSAAWPVKFFLSVVDRLAPALTDRSLTPKDKINSAE